MSDKSTAHIGILTVSDRASQGKYQDLSGPAIQNWLQQVIITPWQAHAKIVADEREQIKDAIRTLAKKCSLVLTTGGTGPAPRDVTPEATEEVCQRIMPGFGELMRAHSLQYVATSILARQTAGILNQTLVINLPGKPKAISESMEAIFPATPYCLDLIGGDWIDTDSNFCQTFRPKK